MHVFHQITQGLLLITVAREYLKLLNYRFHITVNAGVLKYAGFLLGDSCLYVPYGRLFRSQR